MTDSRMYFAADLPWTCQVGPLESGIHVVRASHPGRISISGRNPIILDRGRHCFVLRAGDTVRWQPGEGR